MLVTATSGNRSCGAPPSHTVEQRERQELHYSYKNIQIGTAGRFLNVSKKCGTFSLVRKRINLTILF
jgi:hypothetical protein